MFLAREPGGREMERRVLAGAALALLPAEETVVRFVERADGALDIPVAFRERLPIPLAARDREEIAAIDMYGAGQLLGRIGDGVDDVVGQRHDRARRDGRGARCHEPTFATLPEDVVLTPRVDTDQAPHLVLVWNELHQ